MGDKILIVDDEPLNIVLYSEMLEPNGYIIVSAMDGIEALEVIEKELPRLVILDWNMPRLDGLETLKRIKSNELLKDIPVIMITGVMTSSQNLMEAMKYGAIDFLRKPFDKLELQARVKSMLLLSNSMLELKEKYHQIQSKSIFINILLESVPHPMVYYTVDGLIIGYNSKFLQLVNAEQSLVNALIYRVFDRDNREKHMSSDFELINSKKHITYEVLLNSNNNEYLISKNIFNDSLGNTEGIVCMITEISELKKTHRENLDTKKKELASSALRLIQITELNNNMIGELKLVGMHSSAKGKEMVKEIIKKFSIQSGENVWKEFEMRFENVYESFYSQLNQKFPDLTPGERKLCALLRLNLSTKDIAAITFQNPQSIDVARYRLRKKLNLQNDDNLVDFLLKLD
jgi:DNA-binding response OmpR family regulator/DNA-binding CsgD family transcriptional regulator